MMISLMGIRFVIEFSSILVLAFLCIMHEFTDVTFAKQFNIDHASNQANLEDVDQTSIYLTSQNAKPMVEFRPESLDFGHHPIGMPVIKTVHVYNKHDEIDIQMISISGNTEHFHCSFFEDKIVPPRSNTSFQVVFLARQEGLVNNTLYIHSSIGSFQYRVSAHGEVSPFRVRPLIGARVPLNSSFASLIYIYNPFSTPLQLTEMYTSGGGLHLELPEDEYEASSTLWKVPPYETRPVMKAHFVARIASNHTSYIRIRTNATDVHLMLPVEVEVSSSPGLYSPVDLLDFGVLRAKHDPPKLLPIQVINAALKSIYVQSIVVTPISEGLTVDFNGPLKLLPRPSSPYSIANLALDPSQFSCSGFCMGKVLIKSKNNQYKLSIPFIVRIIQGELYFNSSQSHFFINQSSNYSEQRLLMVKNQFDAPIIVHDIILPDEAKPYFKLTTKHPHSLPVIVPVGSSFPLIRIEFTPSPQLSHFSTTFRLLTNFSNFDLPLYAYRGRLDLFIPNSSDQSKLDIGLVGLNEHKSTTFVVANHNPIAIRIIYWRCNLTGVSVELVGTSQGNVTAVSQRIEPPGLSRSEATLLQPDHFAVFRVHINKLSTEGVYNGFISITTPFQAFTVPLKLKVLRGSLTADKLILPKTFPGKTVKGFLNIKSNYTSHIKIKGAFVEPKDDRFKIKLIDQLIKPGQENQVQITFDASAACFQKLCYSAIDIEKEVGKLWILGNGLYSDTAYIDKELYKLLRSQWLMLKDLDRNPIINVRLQIDGFGSFINQVQAQHHWPRISNKLAIRFPSIRIGKSISKDLLIENTADRPVLLQAINVIDYPNSEILLQQMSSSIFHQQWSRNDLQTIHNAIRSGHNSSAFSLVNNTSTSSVNRLDEWLKVVPHPNSVILLLPPGARHRLAVTFSPLDEKNFTSLLILRNNLTIIDVVMLRGEGGRGLLKIGKTLPNLSNSKLIFEFSERVLERRCRTATPGGAATTTGGGNNNKNLAAGLKDTGVKSHFNALVIKSKAMNIGRMGLQIRNFLIDGMPCEAYGFRINRCEPIFLAPNQTFDIEIVYSPDFTQETVLHELSIIVDDDSISAQRFQLVANIPHKLLRNCLNALPRPVWEDFIYYILLFMTMFVLLLSVIVGVFDASRFTYHHTNQFCASEDGGEPPGKSDSNDVNGTCKPPTDLPDTDVAKKAAAVSSATNGSVVMNGRANSSKVRNRKGNKSNNNNSNYNRNSVSRNKVMNGDVSKLDENKQSLAQSEQQTSETTGSAAGDPANWAVIRKKLLRQDSSSSEHSQRSSDNNSHGKNADSESDTAKNKNTDSSSNENIQQLSSAQSNGIYRKCKLKELDKKLAESKSGKKSKSTKSLSNKSGSEKKSEKVSSCDAATKSSSESLTFPIKFEYDVPTKVRSATLPTAMTNDDSKNTVACSESISSSQSNISSNSVLKDSIKRNNESAAVVTASSVKANKVDKFSHSTFEPSNIGTYKANYQQHCDPKYESTDFNSAVYENPVKDIWDLPITNFDSEHALSVLVKQTEQFAAEKFNPAAMMEKNRKTFSSTKFTEEKWEIGEWSNDLLPPTGFPQPQQLNGSAKSNRYGNECFVKNRNHRGTTTTTTGHGSKDFENRYTEHDNHSFNPNRFKSRSPSFEINEQMSSAAKSNKNSSPINPFSPVIGRPSSSRNNVQASSIHNNYGNNNYNFNLPSLNDISLEKNASFNTAFNSNLLDLLNKKDFYPPMASYPVNNTEYIQPNEMDKNLNSTCYSSPNWNNNSLNSLTSANSFLSPPTSATTSNSIFNFENENVWANSNTSWNLNGLGSKASLFSSFDGPATTTVSSSEKIQSVWPTTTTANNDAFSHSNNENYSKMDSFGANTVWPPFDCREPPPRNQPLKQPINSTLSLDSFDNSPVYEYLSGKSPWSPLSSAPTVDSASNSSLLPTTPASDGSYYNSRFPLNASPSSTTSSTNLSSASSNLENNNSKN